MPGNRHIRVGMFSLLGTAMPATDRGKPKQTSVPAEQTRASPREDVEPALGTAVVLSRAARVVDNAQGKPDITLTLADPVGQRDVVRHDQHPHVLHQHR
jgi:hypothetical protein